MPLGGYVEALHRALEPQRPDWFAYKLSEPKSQAAVARRLTRRTGLDWDPADVAMTNGGFAAIAVAFQAILEPGDEVVFLSPPWFFYEILILAAGGVPVRVPLAPPAFDLDLAAIDAAITPRTRAVLINSPHNPSGRVYPASDLRGAGRHADEGLDAGRPSDLPGVGRAVQPDHLRRPAVPQPGRGLPEHDRHVLVREDAAGAGDADRLPDRAADDARPRGRSGSRSCSPRSRPATRSRTRYLQHAIEDLETLSIDIGRLERRRDRMVASLARPRLRARRCPRARSTSWPASPIEDDEAFGRLLAEEGVVVLPGAVVEVPGWFRISLTANDEMVESSVGAFRRARDRAAGSLAGAAAGA